MKRGLFIFLLYRFVFAQMANAQDIHFSQFDYNPLYLNSALVGSVKQDYRAVLNNRSQWRSVTVPYTTVNMSFDTKINKRLMQKDFIGVGFALSSDKAGDGRLGTTGINILSAYTRALDKNERYVCSAGGYLSVNQMSVDLSKLTFDNQYNGIIFDPSKSSREYQIKSQLFYPDFGMGFNCRYNPKAKYLFNVGVMLNHLMMPRVSFVKSDNVSLKIRTTCYALADIEMNPSITLHPKLMCQFQSAYQEWVMGMSMRYSVSSKEALVKALIVGGYARIKDALILQTGIAYGDADFMFAYDINTSDLQGSSRGKGAWECAIIYKFNNMKKKRIEDIPCFIF